MAFKDSTVYLYGGKIRVVYKDKAHRYYVSDREVWELPKDDDKAWGKKKSTKGVTTMMENTLEKKGLMTWPMGQALTELLGFYNFKNEKGEQMIGFSRNGSETKGSLWPYILLVQDTTSIKDDLLPLIKSASEAYLRKKQKGADIGTVVHDALEHYVRGLPFSIADTYNASIKEADYTDLAEQDRAKKEAPDDIVMAEAAFAAFKKWWDTSKPKLLGAEELLYSLEMNYCGTYDALLEIDGKQVRADWKTSNASKSRDAAAPQGVYYSYFVQLGFYEAAAQEMGQKPSDDLLCVSVRKPKKLPNGQFEGEGGFDLVYASELGLSVQDCIDWAKAVWLCYNLMSRAKTKLILGGIK